MNYIVFDLEWNQCPYGKERENDKLPFEIIEIGAVKLNEQFEIIDNFQCLVQPMVYKKLHYRTQDIIGLSMKDLEKGSPFYRAIREFLKWCGEDRIFCTWGSMDLLELQRNMKYYGVLKQLSMYRSCLAFVLRMCICIARLSMVWIFCRSKSRRAFTGHWRMPIIQRGSLSRSIRIFGRSTILWIRTRIPKIVRMS